jgi:RNA polymerase sigma-70 factor (ECF subfamily)
MDKSDDRDLIRRCIEGEADAWSEFVDRFSGLLYWAINRILNKYNCAYLMGEIEDIYQHLFASIWEKKSLMNVRERANISPWLVVLASNLTIDLIRKKRLEENYLRENLELKVNSQGDKELLRKEDRRLFDNAMRLLDKKERSYLELSYMAGKKHKEIALIFNTSINSVSTIIARAKGKIKKHIEEKQ